ncbi:ABC transporter ATP-binding protein [Pelagibacterium lacus]|uniref:ABC transporter ATP-binding protein n=2 Tax=Pelagibacterium lacus TaxID=2282655 RepID=A0A369W5S3_9HYPH|nr:ABC transporter ATP-binding protein [Pelagibacterium lacus]
MTNASHQGGFAGAASGAEARSGLESESPAAADGPILSVKGLGVRYPLGKRSFWGERTYFEVLDDVSFEIARGETLGLVGESGSGKSTIGRTILRRIERTAGTITFEGRDISDLGGEPLRKLRRRMQLIFQDPYSSLNPRMNVMSIIAEPLVVHGIVGSFAEARPQVLALLDRVGMPASAAERYPHQFSGGQRQRIGIARALALKPSFIVADEPVSALDVSVRAQVVNLMQELQEELGISFLFIAHDLSVVRHISQRVAILNSGQIVEIGARDAIYERPLHPYTQTLLSAVPEPDPTIKLARQDRKRAGGPVPDATGTGCRFLGRCPLASDVCREKKPVLEPKGVDHWVACWNA